MNLNEVYVEKEIFEKLTPGDTVSWDDLRPLMTALGTVTDTVRLLQFHCNFNFMDTNIYPTFVHTGDTWTYTGMCELDSERAKFFTLPSDEIIDGLSSISDCSQNLSVEHMAHLCAAIRIIRLHRNYQLSARLRL